MYRIIREENKLTDKVQYFIERYKGWPTKSWTRELGIKGVYGPIGGQTLDGAKQKLAIIKSGNHIIKEVIWTS
tara:strand:- start:143 stop:361 length:219 start_codon:yes stop_codon:yes gene_type:complete